LKRQTIAPFLQTINNIHFQQSPSGAKMKKVTFVLAFVALIFAVTVSGYAQPVTGSINAYATVLTSLKVNDAGAGSPLEFGYVLPGLTKAVAVNAQVTGLPSGGPAGHNPETQGKFKVEGQASKEFSITVTALPTSLASGANSLTISYDNTVNSGIGYQLKDTDVPGTDADGALAQNDVITTNLSAASARWMFIGGQVSPTTSQVAGLYQGTITIQVAYTGN
jgi:hypothetical protein